MSEIRTNLIISGESSEYRSNLQISVVTLNSNLVDTQSSFRTNLNIVSSLDGKTLTTLNTTLKLENTALDFYLVDMTKMNQSMLYFSKFFNMNFEPEVMWEFLAKGTNEQINISHLSNALSIFSTKAELAQTSSSINALGTSINQHILNSNIHLTQEEKTFISEIMNKPPWGSSGNRSGLFEYINVGNASNVIWAAKPIKYENKDVGIISNTFISCKGVDVTAGSDSGGITRAGLFAILSGEPVDANEYINVKYLRLDENLKDYAKRDWVELTFIKEEKDPTVPMHVKNIQQEQINSWDLVASLFKLSADGSYIITNENRGFVSNSFISCKGLDTSAPESGSGIDMSLIWYFLGQEGLDQINKSHLIEALEDYATRDWVNNQGYLKSFVEQDPTVPSHVKLITTDEITNWNLVTSLFSLSKDSSYVLVESNRGLVSNSFISCRGLDNSVAQIGGGTFDRKALFNILSGEPQNGEFINLKYIDLSNYATTDFVISQGYITSNYLTGYATEQWVKQQGYLTQHQDLSAYAKSADVANTYATKTALQTLQNEHNALSTKVTNLDNLLNSDVSGVINTWGEVVDFLDEYSGSENLATILAGMNNDITAVSNRVQKFEDIIDIDKNGDVYIKGTRNFYTAGGTIGMAGLGTGGSGGGGTAGLGSVTVRVNGEDYVTDASGIVTLPNYPSLAGYATEQWVGNNYLSKSGGVITGDFGVYNPNSTQHTISITTNSGSSWIGYNGTYDYWFITDRGWSNSYALIHSGNYSSYALPLSGGTMQGDIVIPMDNYVRVSSAYEAYAMLGHDSSGILVGTPNLPLLLRSNGTSTINGNAIIHSGNYSSYALPLSGGTISSSHYQPLIINSTYSAVGDVRVAFSYNGDIKGLINWDSTTAFRLYNYVSASYIGVKDDGTPVYNGNTLIHSGNIGSQSVNYANSAGVIADTYANQSINRGAESRVRLISLTASNSTDLGAPEQWVAGLSVMSNYVGWQLVSGGSQWRNEDFYIRKLADNGVYLSWRQLAFTDSNVASATKLQTARTIWGQSFDGTGNVTGNVILGAKNSAIYGYSGTANYNIIDAYTDAKQLLIGYGSSQLGHDTIISGSAVIFTYGSNRTEGVRLNSAGNLLVGAVSDNGNGAKLQVNGAINTTAEVKIGGLDVLRRRDTKFCVGEETTVYASQPTSIYGTSISFLTSYADERMRVADNGNVLIGTTTDSGYKLDINGSLNATTIYQNGQTLDKYYLPLSGGTIKGTGAGLLTINRTNGNPLIEYQNNGSFLGYIGVNTSGSPIFADSNGSYNIIHSGNIGSQSVYNANYVNGFRIFKVADAQLNTDGWYKIALSEREKIAIANFYSGLAWTAQDYGVSASFAGGLDTNGFISWGFNAPTVSFAGSNSSNCSNDTPNWYFSLSGTSGVAYDLNCVPSATKLQTARTIWGQSFDGTGDVSGALYDTSGQEFIYSSGNLVRLGTGTAAKGCNTYIDGNNIYLRYGTTYKDGITLTSSGNVLIGTTTDSGYKLDVNGTAYFGQYIAIANNNGVYFKDASGTIRSQLYVDPSNNTTIGYGAMETGGNTLIYGGNIRFLTSSTNEVMRIMNGNVLIGSPTDNGAKLQVQGAISSYGSSNGVGGYAYYWGTSNQYFLGSNSDNDFYLFSSIAAHLRLGTNDTERMRITSGGNVLIGTTSDGGSKFQTKGHIDTWNDGDYSGVVGFNRKSATGGLYNTNIHGWQIHNYKGDLQFFVARTTGTTGHPITIIGGNENVLIGTTSDTGDKLRVYGSLRADGVITGTSAIKMSWSGASTCGLYPNNWITSDGVNDRLWLYNVGNLALYGSLIEIRNNTTISGNLTVTGDITSEGTMAMARLASSSDRSLKNNIAEVSAEQSMSIIRQLRPTTWNWKKDGKKSYGFIAQEVEPIVPEMVVNMEHLHLEYNQLHAFEIGAIQHIDSEVEILKRRVNELENELKQYRRNA